MDDELTTGERRALDAFAPLAPPAGFADRVLAARAPAPARRRWPFVAGGLVACAAAAAVVALVVTRDPSLAATGELATTERTTAALGRRAIAVAEANTELQWRIADDGAASITQPTGDVFYRVERGGAFVVHTPAGDVRVLGTCFRVEVTPMNKKHLVLSGATGAAIAAAVVITVYEGHVVADTKAAKTELRAGNRAMISPDGRATVGSLDEPVAATLARSLAEDRAATREELIARSAEQRAELARLRAQLAAREGRDDEHNATEPGRRWFDPSPERLKEWAAKCRVRSDSVGLDEPKLMDAKAASHYGLEPDEIAPVNQVVTEIANDWRKLVRALYVEATGDLNGTDVLSVDAMLGEIREKGGGHEHNLVMQKISAERAGLAKPPADVAKLTPYERLMRVQVEQGNTIEAALAKKLGPERARAIRGEGFGNRSDWSGCPDSEN